jgi:hypothetical protein
VVVCAFGEIAVGLAVQEIVDIVAHAEVLKNISDDFETVVINDQVTDVIDATSVVSSVLPLPAIEESTSFDDHYFDAELGTPTGV